MLRSLKKVVRPVRFGLLDPHGGACLDGLHSKRPLGKFSIEAQGKVTAFRLCGIEEIQWCGDTLRAHFPLAHSRCFPPVRQLHLLLHFHSMQ